MQARIKELLKPLTTRRYGYGGSEITFFEAENFYKIFLKILDQSGSEYTNPDFVISLMIILLKDTEDAYKKSGTELSNSHTFFTSQDYYMVGMGLDALAYRYMPQKLKDLDAKLSNPGETRMQLLIDYLHSTVKQCSIASLAKKDSCFKSMLTVVFTLFPQYVTQVRLDVQQSLFPDFFKPVQRMIEDKKDEIKYQKKSDEVFDKKRWLTNYMCLLKHPAKDPIPKAEEKTLVVETARMLSVSPENFSEIFDLLMRHAYQLNICELLTYYTYSSGQEKSFQFALNQRYSLCQPLEKRHRDHIWPGLLEKLEKFHQAVLSGKKSRNYGGRWAYPEQGEAWADIWSEDGPQLKLYSETILTRFLEIIRIAIDLLPDNIPEKSLDSIVDNLLSLFNILLRYPYAHIYRNTAEILMNIFLKNPIFSDKILPQLYKKGDSDKMDWNIATDYHDEYLASVAKSNPTKIPLVLKILLISLDRDPNHLNIRQLIELFPQLDVTNQAMIFENLFKTFERWRRDDHSNYRDQFFEKLILPQMSYFRDAILKSQWSQFTSDMLKQILQEKTSLPSGVVGITMSYL